jgi:hypothetical protein
MVRTYFQQPAPVLTPLGLAPFLPGPLVANPKTFIQAPEAWVGFFQALMNAPAHKEWAKKLLETCLPTTLLDDRAGPMKPLSFSNKDKDIDTCSWLQEETQHVRDLEDSIT